MSKVFRYENYWEDHIDCRKIVSEGWFANSSIEGGWDLFKVKSKNVKNLFNLGVKLLLKMQQLKFLS